MPDRPEPPARDAGGLPEAGPADAGIPERDATVDPLDIRRECLAICAHIVRCAMTGDAAECADDCAEVEPALVNLACEEAVRRGLACFIGATCDELAAGACEVEADLVSATCSGR